MLQQRQVVQVIGQHHAWPLGPLPVGQKLLYAPEFFRTVVQHAVRWQTAWRGEHMAEP
jgi:hypothetical protein